MKAYLALLAAMVMSSPAFSANALPPVAQSKSAEHPWEKDEVLLHATIASVHKDGMKAVAAHAADLEAALARRAASLSSQLRTTATEGRCQRATPARKSRSLW